MKGLGILGVKEEMERNETAMRDAFVFSATPLDATILDNLMTVSVWSPSGSNRHKREKRTQTHWRDFLQDLEG